MKRSFSALRQSLAEGYGLADLRADALAGLVVAMVALPLGMALGIASGVPPQHGLYTVVVAGIAVALLGGSRYQVTGPTAAFVVLLVPVVTKFGLAGLLVAGLMAGIILVALGIARMGQLIQFIPHPVTTGFTSGIAVVIATIQIKDFLGVKFPPGVAPEHYLERVQMLARYAGTSVPAEVGVGLFTLLLLVFWPSRLNNKLPAPIVALTGAALLAIALGRYAGIHVETIQSRFGGIPQAPPSFMAPWAWPGAGGRPFVLDIDTVEALIPSALAIALLGAIESLLSAVVADGMTQTRHDPDAELIGSGIGNILCPFFGGIAATGAIARTATNIRSGAKSPFASVIHAVLVLVAILFFAPVVSYLPMAALAGLLLRVAYNISDVSHFKHMLAVSPRSDIMVLLACFFLTVVFDMVIGVSVGIVLAALLLIRRVAHLTEARIFEGATHPHLKEPLPPGVLLYEIAGPLLFGAAQRAIDAIVTRRAPMERLRVLILDMTHIPVMDVTGLVALESTIQPLLARGTDVLLAGVKGQPLELIRKDHLVDEPGKAHLFENLEAAVAEAKRIAGPARPDDELSKSGRWKTKSKSPSS